MTHLYDLGGGGGDLENYEGHCNVKRQLMMANFEIVEFITIVQHLIDKVKIFF